MPLKKLIGRQQILMPDMLASNNDYSIIVGGNKIGKGSRNINQQESATNGSGFSGEKLSSSIMNQIVGERRA